MPASFGGIALEWRPRTSYHRTTRMNVLTAPTPDTCNPVGSTARAVDSPLRCDPPPAPLNSAKVSGCRFCGIAASRANFDRIILRTPHFLVVPSKGGFLPGWILIVPIHHVLSFAQLDRSLNAELDALTAAATRLLEARFVTPTAFEHGPSSVGTTLGCGIDHAHLHLVPLPKGTNMTRLAEAALGERFGTDPPSATKGYLRIREAGSDAWLSLEPRVAPPRQFFRQIIWEASGRPSESYDYDEAPCDSQVQATLTALVGQ